MFILLLVIAVVALFLRATVTMSENAGDKSGVPDLVGCVGYAILGLLAMMVLLA